MLKKTILASALLVTSMLTHGSTLHLANQDNRQLIPQLSNLLEAHFQRYGHIDGTALPSLETIKDQGRQQRTYQLYRVLGLAIDEDYPLANLQALGLMPTEQGGYQLNLNQNPRWATLADLSIPLTGKLSPIVVNDLISRGFREADITALKQYLSTNQQDVRSAQAQLHFIEQQSPSSLNGLIQHKQHLADAAQLLNQYQKVAVEAQQQWLLDLFEVFDVQRQRILLAYLQERLGVKFFGRAPLTEQSVRRFVERLSSGEESKRLQSTLNARQMEHLQ